DRHFLRLKDQFCCPRLLKFLLGASQRDGLNVDPQRDEIAVVRRKNVPGLAGCNHEAGFRRVGQVVEAAKAAPAEACEGLLGGGVEPATAVEGVETAAGGDAQIREPVEQRNLAEDAMLELRPVLVPPAPLVDIRPVPLREKSECV